MKTLRTIALSILVAGLLTLALGSIYIARANAAPSACQQGEACQNDRVMFCIVTPKTCDIPSSTATTWEELLLPPTKAIR